MTKLTYSVEIIQKIINVLNAPQALTPLDRVNIINELQKGEVAPEPVKPEPSKEEC